MQIKKSSFFAIIILVNGLFFALGMLCATWLDSHRSTSTGYPDINIVSSSTIIKDETGKTETDVLEDIDNIETISKEDIIGVWYIDAEYTYKTLNLDISTLGFSTIKSKTLEFKEDGTYIDTIFPASHSTEYTDDYTGTYELITTGEEVRIKLTSNSNQIVEYRILNNKIAYMLITEGESLQYIYLTK